MNPHIHMPVIKKGVSLENSKAVVIAVHGRNQTAQTMEELIQRFQLKDVHYLLPQASGNSWYPFGFMEEIAKNEPYLTYSLEAYDRWLNDLYDRGIPPEKIILLGFSQGACLTAEYAIRNPKRYGGIILYTGGVIGPRGTKWSIDGSFEGTPVFLGTSDIDEWVPEVRVLETAHLFKQMKAHPKCEIYKGMDHIINDDEVKHGEDMIRKVIYS